MAATLGADHLVKLLGRSFWLFPSSVLASASTNAVLTARTDINPLSANGNWSHYSALTFSIHPLLFMPISKANPGLG